MIDIANNSNLLSRGLERLTEPHASATDPSTRRVLRLLATWHLLTSPLGPLLALSQLLAGEAHRISAVWLVAAPIISLANYVLCRSRWGKVTLWLQVMAIYSVVLTVIIIRPDRQSPVFALVIPAMTAALCLSFRGYMMVQVSTIIAFMGIIFNSAPERYGEFVGTGGVLGASAVLLATLVAHQQWLRRIQTQQLAEETARSQSLLEVVFDGTATVVEDRIIATTPGFADALGIAGVSLVGRAVDDAMPFKLHEPGVLAEAVPFLDASGSLRYVACVRQRIGRPEDRRDVLAVRNQTTEQLHKANLQYAGRMTAVGTVAAGVAHEVNNALMSLLGQAEIAQLHTEGAGDDKIVNTLERIIVSGERIAACVSSLQKFSSGGDDKPTPVDLNEIVESTVGLARFKVRHVAQLEVNLAAKLAQVMAVEAWVSQVLMNLLLNAVDAVRSQPRREISVTTLMDEGTVVVRVQDSGEGVSEANAEHLFQPFFTTKGEAGSGLGLSISASLAARMGGTMAMVKVSEGACFELRLPPADVSDVVESTEAAPPLPIMSPEHSILLVEDERQVAEALAELLKPAKVQCADSVASAKKAWREDYDLVLSDVIMPEASGLELRDWIEQEHPEMLGRLVLMTGSCDDLAPQVRALPESQRLVGKPITRDTLLRLLIKSDDAA